MDQQIIKALIDAFAASDMSVLEYSADGATLRLARSSNGQVPASAAPHTVEAGLPAQPAPQASAAPVLQSPWLVASPLYGVVHLHRSPGSAPLCAVGGVVAAGQVLCLIEAMKVFTELRADRDGTLEAVLVTTGQEVEAGQPLFRLASKIAEV